MMHVFRNLKLCRVSACPWYINNNIVIKKRCCSLHQFCTVQCIYLCSQCVFTTFNLFPDVVRYYSYRSLFSLFIIITATYVGMSRHKPYATAYITMQCLIKVFVSSNWAPISGLFCSHLIINNEIFFLILDISISSYNKAIFLYKNYTTYKSNYNYIIIFIFLYEHCWCL